MFPSLFFNHGLYANDANVGTQESKRSKYDCPVPCYISIHSELNEYRELCKKSNVLIGWGHDDWNHIIFKEKRSKNTTRNTGHAYKNWADHTSKCQLYDFLSVSESQIFFVPVIIASKFNFMNMINERYGVSSGTGYNGNIQHDCSYLSPNWHFWVLYNYLSYK